MFKPSLLTPPPNGKTRKSRPQMHSAFFMNLPPKSAVTRLHKRRIYWVKWHRPC